jgi:hypothetical protein
MNREKAATPAMLASLSNALDMPVDATALIAPLEADSLMTGFRTGYSHATERGAPSYRRFFHQGELPLLLNLTDSLVHRLGAEEVYLLTKFEGDCRVVVLNVTALFSRVGAVIEFDGDSLCALSKDHSQGVLIDHNPDDLDQTYELTVWGDRWPLLV